MKIMLVLTFIFTLSHSETVFANQLPEFSENVPVAFRVYLTAALEKLFSVQGSSSTPLHSQIFNGAVSGEIYRRWFNARVRRIEIKKDNCNYAAKIDSEGEPGIIYISNCVNHSPGPEQQFYWLSILFHEARHLEPANNFWKHDVCLDTSGGLQACDKTHFGPYGLEKIFSRNVALYCTNCSPTFKAQATEVYEDDMNWRRLSHPAQVILEKDLGI